MASALLSTNEKRKEKLKMKNVLYICIGALFAVLAFTSLYNKLSL